MRDMPISDYALLSDCNAAALVSNTTQGGQMVITDALALGSGEREHNLGHDVPHALMRRVECVSGKVTMGLEYAPRPEYGLVFPLLALADGGVISRGGASVLALSSSVSLDIQESSVTASHEMKEGEVLHFALQRRLDDRPSRQSRKRTHRE